MRGMAGTRMSKRAAATVLLVTMAVLIAGILAVLTYDDSGKKATTLPVPTTAPAVRTSTTAKPTTSTTAPASTSTSSTLQNLPGITPGATTSTEPTTTAEPAVPTPEQAASGLFAAYRNGDRTQAQMFATDDVIAAL